MAASRSLLVVILLVLGGMIYWVHMDIGKLADGVANVGNQIERIRIEPAPVAQRATGWITKTRVPAVKHIYKKAPTIIDQICRS